MSPETQFGRYQVVAPIARGGMAEVFAGRLIGEGGFNRMVAIKRIRPDLLADPEYVTMFLDEARLAANIQSPHVVATQDLGRTEDGVPFMVMDLVLGTTLSQLGRAHAPRPIPLPFALEILAQSLQGLFDAHSAIDPTGEPLRIVHRDIAPKNILIGLDGRARIMDFGIAHAVERLTSTQSGQIKGTVRYFSPEQANLENVDQRSDIFSMGVVAFEVLTAKRLFKGRTMLQIFDSVISGEIPDLRDVEPDVPAPVAEAVGRALERDPSRRWASATEFGQALRSANPSPPSLTEMRALIRTNLPPKTRELARRLREGSEPFKVQSPYEDDVADEGGELDGPTVVSPPPKMDSDSPPTRRERRTGGEKAPWWKRLFGGSSD